MKTDCALETITEIEWLSSQILKRIKGRTLQQSCIQRLQYLLAQALEQQAKIQGSFKWEKARGPEADEIEHETF